MSKQATTYSEQLDVLVSRGLVVENRDFAEHCLAHHNYYRLSAYRFFFMENGNPDRFAPGTKFEQLWNLYRFDRGLRQLLLEATKRIEISIRSRLAYEIGHRLGPLAYLENIHFRDPLIHARTLVKLDGEMSRSKEKFIGHHRDILHMKWPPIWVVVEVASFGTISNLLNHIEPPQIRQAIADSYKMDEKTFCSLFHHLSVLRNTAAHHSRLWNRKFVVTFQLPKKKPADLWPNFNQQKLNGNGKDRHIYNTLVLLVHFIRCIDPQSCWTSRLLKHLSTLEHVFIQEMGFPNNWLELPIWAEIHE